MSNISKKLLLKAINQSRNEPNIPPQKRSPRIQRGIVVGAIFGLVIYIMGNKAQIFLGVSPLFFICVTAVLGGIFNYAVSRYIYSEEWTLQHLSSLDKDLILIRHMEKNDTIGSRFTEILREVLEKDGITPKQSLAMIRDIVSKRKSISESYYIIAAVLGQTDAALRK